MARLLAPALPLALCDDIGQAASDTEAVALAFVRLLPALEPLTTAGVAPGLLEQRYGVAVFPLPGEAVPDAETWLAASAQRHTSGDTLRMAQRLLDDFRRSLLGPIALELPESIPALRA